MRLFAMYIASVETNSLSMRAIYCYSCISIEWARGALWLSGRGQKRFGSGWIRTSAQLNACMSVVGLHVCDTVGGGCRGQSAAWAVVGLAAAGSRGRP